MVDEYLQQTGVPLNYVNQLTQAMIKYAGKVGIPDENDIDAVKMWHAGLLDHVRYHIPKVAKRLLKGIKAAIIPTFFFVFIRNHRKICLI